jgi:type II secretory pathway component PulF
MLRDLADYFEQRLALSRKITGMMVYPALQLIFAWFLGTFALGLIARLNLNSAAPFNIRAYVGGYLAFQGGVVAFALAMLLALWIVGRAGLAAAAIGRVAGHVPPFRGVLQKFALARFFRCLSLLLSAGLPVKASLENAARVAGDAALQRDVAAALPLIQRGATLSDAFARARALTPAAREMLRVGEQSGKVDEMLYKAAEYHAAEAEHAVQVSVKLANVLIVLAVGGVVGFIVISFYARYFGMLNDLL